MTSFVNKETLVIQSFPVPVGDEWIPIETASPSDRHVIAVIDGVAVWVEPEETREYKHFAPRDMLNLFAPERVAIMQAKANDVQVAIWYDDLIAARYVTYSDEATKQGMAYMLQSGLLTQARHDEIVAILTAEREG